MDISIIIPTTKNRESIFHQTLDSVINAIAGLNAEILIVNDTPGYQPRPNLFLERNNVKFFDNPGKGVAAARNYGALQASGTLLLFLDNDIIISRRSVEHIIGLHQTIGDACVNPDWVYPHELLAQLDTNNFGRFLQEQNMTSFKGWYNDASWQSNSLFASRSVASFHLSITKSNFEKSGGYNTSFPHAGFEDHDLPVRLKRAGIDFYIDTRITVLHNELDKLNLAIRLQNLEMRAETRKVAVTLGYSELKLNYNWFQKTLLPGIYFFKRPLINILNCLPNRQAFYKIYCKLLKVAEAAVIYHGYNIQKDEL